MDNQKEFIAKYAREHRSKVSKGELSRKSSVKAFKDVLREVNYNGYRKYTEEEVKNFMEKTGLRYFANQKEYEEYYYNVDVYRERPHKYGWKDYSHIKDLVSSGQYETIRDEYARQEYIYKLQEIGVSDDIINYIETMPIKDFMNKYNAEINPDKTDLKENRIPLLGFKYKVYADELAEDEAALIRAFNIPTKEDDTKDKDKPSKEIIHDTKNIDNVFEELKENTIDVVKDIMQEVNRVKLSDTNILLRRLNKPREDTPRNENMIKRANTIKDYVKMIQKNKTPIIETYNTDGTHKGWYIPFVGSTTGSRSQLIKDIIGVVNENLIRKGKKPIDI